MVPPRNTVRHLSYLPPLLLLMKLYCRVHKTQAGPKASAGHGFLWTQQGFDLRQSGGRTEDIFFYLAADRLPGSDTVCEQFPAAGRREPSLDISSARCPRGAHRTGRWPGSSACTLAEPVQRCEVRQDWPTSHLVPGGGVWGQVGASGRRVAFPRSYGTAATALGGLDGLEGGQGRAAGRLSGP